MGSCGIAQVGGAPVGALLATEQGVIIENITPATAVGSTDDRVLLFNAASIPYGTVPLGTWLSRSDSATLGTVCTILQPGFYSFFLNVPWTGANNIGCFVTRNATAAQRQAGVAADYNQPEIFSGMFKQNPTIQGNAVTGVIPITAAIIAAGQNTIRAHAWNPITPGVPVAQPGAFVNGPATCLKIWRTGDIAG